MSERIIRIVPAAYEGAPYGVNCFVPGRIVPSPIAADGKVTILAAARFGEPPWHPDLSVEENAAAYSAVKQLNAIGVQVIDIGNRTDGTSRLAVSVRALDRVEEVAAILRDAFDLHDCTVTTD
jgi:hypothetical protein